MVVLSQRVVEQCRVVVDNDFAGDPDGILALAHHLLSPSNRVVAITSSFLNPRFVVPPVTAGATAQDGALLAAALPAARRAMVGAGGALVVLGTAGLALDEGAALHLAFLATGVAMVVASTVVGRHQTRN